MAEPLQIPQVTDPQLADIQRSHMLAQALLQQAGNGSPVGSPWQAVNRAISPLLGALLEKNAMAKYGALSSAAAPEYAKLADTDNPIALAAASQNPLVRAMLPDLLQQQLGIKAKGAEEAALGKARLGYMPQLQSAIAQGQVAPHVAEAVQTAQGTAPIDVKKAVDIARATNPLEIAKGVAVARAQADPFGIMSGMNAPPKPDAGGFVVGQTYTDKNGARATYKGNGQWQEIP